MQGAVYLLCGVTALVCSLLLFRGYRRSKVRLLLWSALFFAALTMENGILFIDVILVPATDLSVYRNSIALAGMSLLLYGLIWESK